MLASEYPEKQDAEWTKLSLKERLDLALSQNIWPDRFVVGDFVFDLTLRDYEVSQEYQEENIDEWKGFLIAYVLETDPEKYSASHIETVNQLLDGYIPECMPPSLPQEVRDILRKKPKDLEDERKAFLIRVWETTIARAVVHAEPKYKKASYHRGGFNDQQRREYLKLLPTIFPDFLPEETKELINKPPEYFLYQELYLKSRYNIDVIMMLPLQIQYFVHHYSGEYRDSLCKENRYLNHEGKYRLTSDCFGLRSLGEGIVVVRYHDQDKITVEPFSEKYLVPQNCIQKYDKLPYECFGNIMYIIDDSFYKDKPPVPEGHAYFADAFEPPKLEEKAPRYLFNECTCLLSNDVSKEPRQNNLDTQMPIGFYFFLIRKCFRILTIGQM